MTDSLNTNHEIDILVKTTVTLGDVHRCHRCHPDVFIPMFLTNVHRHHTGKMDQNLVFCGSWMVPEVWRGKQTRKYRSKTIYFRVCFPDTVGCVEETGRGVVPLTGVGPHKLYTGLLGGLEHLKIETRLIDKKITSVMGECVIVKL
jgi:hypothetical protein